MAFSFNLPGKVLVKVCYPTSRPPNLVHLQLGENLSKIRKELEMRKFINDKLSFSQNIIEMSKVENSDEGTFRLNEIIVKNNEKYILYLIHSNLGEYMNEKHKLNYGRTITNDGIKTNGYKVFNMKGCKLYDLGTKEFRLDKVEFNSIETEDWLTKSLLLDINSKLQSFVNLGFSAGIVNRSKSKLETNSTYYYRNYGKFSMNINITEHLILTEEFLQRVNDAIKSKKPKNFIQIIEDYGHFIPTEVIFGGRIYFKDSSRSTEYSTGKENDVAINLSVPSNIDVGISRSTNHTIGILKDYRSNCLEFIGGKLGCLENFDELAWVKSLEDYNNWECIDFRNSINIFQLLSDELQRKIFVLLGKKVIYSKTETRKCTFESGIPAIFTLRDANISKTLQNKDADCNIFATVINEEETNNEFFNCQILWLQDDEPRLIIHCIQKKSRKCSFNLKISWMVIGYDINFDYLLSAGFNVQLKVLKSDFNSTTNQIMMSKALPIKCVPPCIGIPVLNRLDTSQNDYSLVIGHHFCNIKGRNDLFAFGYCLKNKCYVNLPSFTFYTLFSNAYESLPLKVRKRDFLLNRNPFVDIGELISQYQNPKYVSLYLSKDNNYNPMFLNHRCKRIELEYVKCSCNKTCSICNEKSTKISILENIACIFFNPCISKNSQSIILDNEWFDEEALHVPVKKFTADFNQAEIKPTTISKTTITIRHLRLLITYQRQDGCFEITDNVASLFNFSSKNELIQSFTAHVQKDDHVIALHVDVWSSALITALLKALLWTHRREWNT
ncbi:180_t:CDS:2, partial [Funneliformis geosporum]